MIENAKLKVWFVVNPPNTAMYVSVETPDDAVKVIQIESRKQLKNPRIFANAFGLVELDEGAWTEWYHPEHGCDISQYEDEFYEANEKQPTQRP